jgi:hypothetical protein
MKNLLLAIQTRLREIEGLRDVDVFLSPDKDLVPAGQKFPCIGIKDGAVAVEHLAGEVNELTLPVEIYVYEQLIKVDTSIVSLFELASSVQTQLTTPLPGSYIKDVDHGGESAIMLLYRDGGMLMRKTVFYQYIKEE